MLRKLLLAAVAASLSFGSAFAGTTYSKPTVRDAWADQAASGDITDPGNSFVAAGWLSSTTPPARQYFNWAFNYPSVGVRYFMQRGLVDWDTLETYGVGAVVRGPDGLLYQSKVASNIGNTPASSPSDWGPLTAVAPASGDSSNNIPTTSFVQALVSPLAPKASPAFTGVPTAPTAATNTSTTQIATTANVMADITSAISPYALKASPVFVGLPQAPTAAANTNTTQIATTANVMADLAPYALSTTVATKAPLASPIFTGSPQGPTAAAGTDNAILATTEFVQSAANPGSSITTPGYQKFLSGLILEWGLAACESSAPGTSVTFPLAFPHAVMSVQVTAYGESATVTVLSQNTADFACINGSNYYTNWFAVGY